MNAPSYVVSTKIILLTIAVKLLQINYVIDNFNETVKKDYFTHTICFADNTLIMVQAGNVFYSKSRIITSLLKSIPSSNISFYPSVFSEFSLCYSATFFEVMF